MNEVIDLLKLYIKELEAQESLTLREVKTANKELEQIDMLLCLIAQKIDELPRGK